MAVASQTKPVAVEQQRGRLQRFLGRDFAIAWPFLVPLILVLVGLIAYPFFSAITLSFQRKMVGSEPVFIGVGSQQVEGGWVDAKGMFLAGVGAGNVYRLLGRKDMGVVDFPLQETALVDGHIA